MRKYQEVPIPRSIDQKQGILREVNGKQVIAKVDEERNEYLGGMLIYTRQATGPAIADVYFLHGENGKSKRFLVHDLGGLLVQLGDK